MDKNRELGLMSPLKTAMMLLVVLYHCCVMWAGGGWFDEPAVQCAPLGALALWMNTFHVPMFVFASGYVHSYLRRETNHYGAPRAVLARKARKLLLPCVLVSLLWAAPAYGLFFSMDNLAGKFLLMESPSQLWFLPMLFWCFVVIELAWLLAPGLLRGFDVRVGVALALLAVGSPLVSKLTDGAFQLASACQYLIVFWAGWAFRSVDSGRFWNVRPTRFIFADVILFALWRVVAEGDGIVASLASQSALVVLRLLGCAMVLSVAGRARIPKSRFWSVFGRDSFGVYLFHQQLVWIALAFLNVPSVPPILAASVAFFASLTVSLGMTELLRRFKATKLIIGEELVCRQIRRFS